MADSAGRMRREALLAELRSERFGRALRLVEETASTIDLAWEWLEEGAPEGAVVIAERQTGGRGRLGRPWASPPGGLWMSLIARPFAPTAAAGRLGIAMGVAAAEGVREASGVKAGVKWPNDIVFGRKKLGGVLVETRVEGKQVTAAVLSLGLNVNISPAGFPEEIREEAASLSGITGREHDRASIAARILERLEQLWGQATGLGMDLLERWRKLDAFHGLQVEVQLGDEVIRGRDGGLSLGGELVLMTEKGDKMLSAGEVRSVRSGGRCQFVA